MHSVMLTRISIAAHIIVIYFAVSLEGKVTPSGKVVVLTDANFDNVTREGTWLVDIYAPW
jgi:hypothetical protein